MALDTDQVLEVRDGVDRETVETVQNMGAYKYGWNTDIEMDYAPMGVNEDIVRLISSKNGEPEWMTDWRLQAFRRWQEMEEPTWAMLHYPHDRLSVAVLLRQTEKYGREAEVAWRRSIRSFWQHTKSLVSL